MGQPRPPFSSKNHYTIKMQWLWGKMGGLGHDIELLRESRRCTLQGVLLEHAAPEQGQIKGRKDVNRKAFYGGGTG